jgi:hypothetical protein
MPGRATGHFLCLIANCLPGVRVISAERKTKTSQAMKNTLLIALLLTALLGCQTSDPLPAEAWSSGCVEFAPDAGGYRLNLGACSYILLPAVRLNGSKQFQRPGTFHTFTGAGFAEYPTTVSGQLVSDNTLVINYTSGNALVVLTLSSGRPAKPCLNYCD